MSDGIGEGPWGELGWGIESFGGGSPSVSGNVSITSVTFITPTFIRVGFNTTVVVNSAYLSAGNYIITPKADSSIIGIPVRTTAVKTPTQNAVTSNYAYLRTSLHTNGAEYLISFVALTTLDGIVGTSPEPVPYQSRFTKTSSMLKSLPVHFNKSDDSLVSAVIGAIASSDDKIGGSRSDEFST